MSNLTPEGVVSRLQELGFEFRKEGDFVVLFDSETGDFVARWKPEFYNRVEHLMATDGNGENLFEAVVTSEVMRARLAKLTRLLSVLGASFVESEQQEKQGFSYRPRGSA